MRPIKRESAEWRPPFRLLPALLLFTAALAAPVAPPNVIIFYADDQGYQDLSCFGSPSIKTPNIDRIGAEGCRFTDFYSAYCVCSASRAALMTGSYQPRISMPGVLGPKSKVALNPDEVVEQLRKVMEDYDAKLKAGVRPPWKAGE